MLKKIILLIGLPGSGKGTQGVVISKELGIPHISTGDIFRKMVEDNTEDSALLNKCMKEGKLIPNDLVNRIIKKYILSDDCRYGCILDGYPRTLKQAEYFIENIDAEITTIFLDLDYDIAMQRILGRINCVSCGKVYNEYFDKPEHGKCDVCGLSKFSSRTDDDKKIIASRLEEYKNETLPMIEYYKKNGMFFTVNADQGKQKVVEEVMDIIKNI